MRHFLKFLPADKREAAQREYGEPAPINADERQAAEDLEAKSKAVAEKKAAAAQKAAAVIAAAKVAQHKAAQANAPRRPKAEFGGLIERRLRDNRPAVGQERRDNVYEDPHAQTRPSVDDLNGLEIKMTQAIEGNLGSTGSYLSALDNSAITLADSGIFKPEEEESFNPYNKT